MSNFVLVYVFETELVSASFSAYLNGHTSKKGLIFHDHHHHFIYRIIQGAAAAAIKNKQLLLLSELVYVNLCSYSPHKAHAKNLGFRIYIYMKTLRSSYHVCIATPSLFVCSVLSSNNNNSVNHYDDDKFMSFFLAFFLIFIVYLFLFFV